LHELAIAHAPRAHDFAPVRDRYRRPVFGFALMKVRRIEIELVRLDTELRIGNPTFSNEDHLIATTERVDDRRPLFQRGVIWKFPHGLKVTELTGPSQIVTAVTIAFSSATALDNSR